LRLGVVLDIKNMFKNIKKNQKGVTLLELTVSVTIFSIIMLAVTQIFRMVVEGQRNAIAAQNVQESVRYAMEVMSKEIRTAKKDEVTALGQCANVQNGRVYDVNGQGDELYIRNYKDECVTYRLNGDRLEIERYPVGNPTSAIADFITPEKIKVSNLKFSAVDNVGADQSMVTIRMDIEAIGKTAHKQGVTLQTTISSRYYE